MKTSTYDHRDMVYTDLRRGDMISTILFPGVTADEASRALLVDITNGKRLRNTVPHQWTTDQFDNYRNEYRSWVRDVHAQLINLFMHEDAANLFGDYVDPHPLQPYQPPDIRTQLSERLGRLTKIYLECFPSTPDPATAAMLEPTEQFNVLISWSKPISYAIADKFYNWLPTVLPGAKPWISTEDIDKGKLWFQQLQAYLSRSEVQTCILFITPENVRSPYLYYESGAISARVSEKVLICTYLVGERPDILKDGPLQHYQATVATKGDTFRLLKTLNKSLPTPLSEVDLRTAFDVHWPDLSEHLEKALASVAALPNPDDGFIETDADTLAGFKLSSECRRLLTEACDDEHGMISRGQFLDGTYELQTNGVALANNPNVRERAKWEEAVRNLEANDLIRDVGHKRELFEVTAKGFEVADLLGDDAPQG